MTSIYTIQTSFNTGEVSPDMRGRPDLNKYTNGVGTMLNFYPQPFGGASNRSGTEYIATAKDSDHKVRIVPFQFSVLQAYVLEFGHNYIRFYKDGAPIVYPAGDPNEGEPVEQSTSYNENQIFDLKFAQSADVLYICHPEHDTYTLTRTSHTNWVLARFDFKNGPFIKQNTTDTTITPSGTGVGTTITLTASSSIFKTNHIGALWRISHEVEGGDVSGDLSGATYSTAIKCKGTWKFTTSGTWSAHIKLERSTDEGATWKQLRSYISDAGTSNYIDQGDEEDYCLLRLHRISSNSAINYDLQVYPYIVDGVVEISTVTNGTTATARVITEIGSTTATKLWAEGAWSAERGFPRCTKFFQDRLGFAGTDSDPLTIWFSQVGDYLNFKVNTPTKDDDALTKPLVSQGVNTIQSMIALGELLAFTKGGEWKAGPGSSNAAISPTNFQAVQQGYRGSSTLEPLIIGNRVLFVQEMGSTVRDLGYSLQDDSYTGNDLTILARHMFRNYTIVDWAYQQEPDSIVWAVRNDGVLLGFCYLREQDVWAWSRHTTQGQFESVTTIPGNGYNEVWFVVKRTVGGVTKRFIERMTMRLASVESEDQFFVDAGLIYDGAPTTTITGLDHLAGMTVKVLADGNLVGDKTVGAVTGGIGFTLDNTASKVIAGLGYTCDIETLNIEFPSKDGTVQGRPKRIPSVVLRLENSRGGYVGMNSTSLVPIEEIQSSTWGDPAPLFTGDVKTQIQSEFNLEGRIFVRQSDPLPMTILAIMAEVEWNG